MSNDTGGPSTSGGDVVPSSSLNTQPSSPVRRTGIMNALTRNLFGTSNRERTERQMIDMVTTEGSIKKEAWTLMSRGNNARTRIRCLGNLQEVMKNKNLQVSTLEGIWHETKDMLNEPETREPTLKAIIELTQTQYSQLGLALRHTFFEKIRELGCEEKTLKWLSALSEDGKNVLGFEKAMDFLVADWIELTLSEDDHPQALKVIQLAQQLIMHNSAFVCEASMIKMVKASCMRCASIGDPHTNPCLELLSNMLKYSDLPRSQLDYVVTTLCCLLCDATFREQTWGVARQLLTSNLGHRTRNILLNMLEHSAESIHDPVADKPRVVRALRGAVYCIAQITWGTQKVEKRSSPANVIPSMEKAVVSDADVCSDVLIGLRRLIQKFGRDLQHMTWRRIIRLFHVVYEMCRVDPAYAECQVMLNTLIDQMEQLHVDGQFTGASDALFDLIEACSAIRSDQSIVSLVSYRADAISQLTPDWINRMHDLVEKYTAKDLGPDIRTKAVSVLHVLYTKNRMFAEHQLVMDLMLPALERMIPCEQDCHVQYQMVNVLFDVAKTVAVRAGESQLFDQVVSLIRRLFLDGLKQAIEHSPTDVKKESNGVCLENMEIVALGIDDILRERFTSMQTPALKNILDTLIDHLQRQYEYDLTSAPGGDVRTRVFSAILPIICCPTTKRIMRYTEDKPVAMNVFTKAGDESKSTLSWESICDVVTVALVRETWWPVIRQILCQLWRVLELSDFVYTAGREKVNRLVNALVGLAERVKNGAIDVSGDEFAKRVPLVLATALHYTKQEKSSKICGIIIDCVKLESIEAILACNMAMHRAPQAMTLHVPQLVDHLAALPPTATRAIPIIELLADGATVQQFHKFFDVAHFKMVTDILAPYTNVRQFNAFIVASVHRILMAWFAKVAESDRPEMRKYMEEKVRDAPLLYAATGSVSRQASGDGRQVPGLLFLIGGMPETPPPMGGVGFQKNTDDGQEKMTEEIERALSVFMWLGRIDESVDDPVGDRLVETSQEHFWVNDHILTVRTLRVKEKEAEQPPDSPISPASPSPFSEQRRRHQSAIQTRRMTMDGGETPRRTRDDSFADRAMHRSNTIMNGVTRNNAPIVTYTQLIVRNMYSKTSWLMRSLATLNEDFERTRGIPACSVSLLQHVAGMPTAVQLVKKNNEDNDVNLRLRNLDRVPGMELHAVGVLYKAQGQNTEAQFLANVYGSDRYARFIRLLGEPTSLDKCPGGLIKGRHGTYTYQYKDEINKLVFLVASLMPRVENDPQCNEKKKLIGNNFVTIVFNESGTPYELGNGFAHVAIEIVPSDALSLLVVVHAKKDIRCWLGLSRVLLPDQAAVHFIRSVVVRSQLNVNVWRSLQDTPDQPYLSLAIDRLRKIRALKERSELVQSRPVLVQ